MSVVFASVTPSSICYASVAGVKARQKLTKKIVEETMHFANGPVKTAIRKTITISKSPVKTAVKKTVAVGEGVATASMAGSVGKSSMRFLWKFSRTKLGIAVLAGAVFSGITWIYSYKHGMDTLNKRLEILETRYNIKPEDYTKDKKKVEAVIKEADAIMKKPSTSKAQDDRIAKIDALISSIIDK